jgi:FKBP-type peptidyl-prolyl cis-trans isomerase FklB
MKSLVTATLCLAIVVSCATAQKKTELKTQKDKVSYLIGREIGGNFKKQGVEVNTDILLKGIRDGIAGNKSPLSDEESESVMTAFQNEMMGKQAQMQKDLAEKNLKEGKAFLAANAKKEGVKTTPSGLQYKVLVEGNGKTPTATDTVIAHYRGRLIDGTEFDDSYKRGEPLTIPVSGVIKGWTEALQMMKVGSKWQLFIPSELAYGEQGAGQVIGPNETLIFDIELLGIK